MSNEEQLRRRVAQANTASVRNLAATPAGKVLLFVSNHRFRVTPAIIDLPRMRYGAVA